MLCAASYLSKFVPQQKIAVPIVRMTKNYRGETNVEEDILQDDDSYGVALLKACVQLLK